MHMQARAMFDRMEDHGCAPDAVTYANLIRAYKKGGQWCQAVATFEAMQASGCSPHAAVYSSVIDVLWQTGVVWAQAKAAQLFNAAVKYVRRHKLRGLLWLDPVGSGPASWLDWDHHCSWFLVGW